MNHALQHRSATYSSTVMGSFIFFLSFFTVFSSSFFDVATNTVDPLVVARENKSTVLKPEWSGLMKHIDNDRLHEFAIEAIDLKKSENIHLDDCVTCRQQLVAAVQLVCLHEERLS